MFKYLVSVALVAVTASASGEEISAFQGGSIDLGAYQGIVYYVDEGDEFRVVTTLSAPESLVPHSLVHHFCGHRDPLREQVLAAADVLSLEDLRNLRYPLAYLRLDGQALRGAVRIDAPPEFGGARVQVRDVLHDLEQLALDREQLSDVFDGQAVLRDRLLFLVCYEDAGDVVLCERARA